MLKIRKDQMDAFSQASVRNFEDRMVVHLNKFFPQHCEALGDDGVREAVQYGIERAAFHAIVAERDVCKYTDLMFAFGPDFDIDPSLSWARKILAQPGLGPTRRVNRLYDTAMKHVGEAAHIAKNGEA